MSIDTTKPSPELDFAVAEALGWTKHEHPPMPLLGTDRHWQRPDGSRVERWHTQSNYGEDECWPFSTDWTAAIEAAERVGLFGQSEQYDGYWLTFGHAFPSIPTLTTDGNWVISVRSGEVGQLFIAPTGPLAICRAILELKEPA